MNETKFFRLVGIFMVVCMVCLGSIAIVGTIIKIIHMIGSM